MAQATCRIRANLDEILDDAAEEAGAFRSDIIRRALNHYAATNPDGLRAFDGWTPNAGRPSSRDGDDRDGEGGPYDPTADL
jgi:hypothetical protein